ncbi:hypothetical protein EON66_00175 [archaeon]|nr:MAG: hypothetical protein EON66_00175 [archaeon]
MQAEVSAYTSAYEATASSTTASLQRLLEAWEARYQHLARTVQVEMLDISAVSERSLPELATLLDLQRDANAIVERAIKDELRVHVGLEAMLEVFESVITELRVSKLGLHEAFFRNVETHENNFFTQLCTAGIMC